MKSKKRSFGLILLISVLVIVIAFYAVASGIAKREKDKEQNKGGDNSTEIVFIDKQAADISKITYSKNGGGSEFTIIKSGSTYVLEADNTFPLDRSAVAFVLNAAAKIVFERRIDPEGNELEEYGLKDPHTVITAVYTDGAKVELKLGNYNKYSESYYCTVGDGFVYLLVTDFSEAFDYEFSDLLFDDSVQTPQNGFSSLTDIEISKDGKTVTLSASDDGKWIKTDENGNAVEGDFASDAAMMYREFYLGTVDEWVAYNASSDEVRDGYGLKGPDIKVTFKHIETKVIENEGSASITKEYERTTSFLIGSVVDSAQSEESRERYFMFGDGSIVYVKAEADFKTAFTHLSE